jgi:hypothetical protein
MGNEDRTPGTNQLQFIHDPSDPVDGTSVTRLANWARPYLGDPVASMPDQPVRLGSRGVWRHAAVWFVPWPTEAGEVDPPKFNVGFHIDFTANPESHRTGSGCATLRAWHHGTGVSLELTRRGLSELDCWSGLIAARVLPVGTPIPRGLRPPAAWYSGAGVPIGWIAEVPGMSESPPE